MADEFTQQSAEIEDDFLEESLSKPIFYSAEVEEAISQVSTSCVRCIFGVNVAVN